MTDERGETMTKGTAVLYARVSTREQADSGYSIRQQTEALRVWCEAEGFEVLEEVTDPGHSGAHLERPGLDQVRDLVAAGGVSVVLAQDRDRFAREPAYLYLLKREFEGHGTKIRALNDRGDDSPEGQFMDGVLDQLAKLERAKTAERTRRGLDRKVAEGKVIRGNQQPFGFRYSEDGEALLVSEPEMRVVRRIFRQVGAEGLTMGEVRRRLRAEGVPSAMGGGWPRSTIRYLLLNELYLPRRPAELEGLLPAPLLAALDPDREYGLWCWNRTKQTRWRERGEDGAYRNRVKNEPRPREEWSSVPVDLSGSGLSRGHAHAARERLAENGRRRPASTRASRFWLLSGGLARCAHCGNALSPYASLNRGKVRAYYRCYTRFNHGLDACDNGRSTQAAALEEAVWEAVSDMLYQPRLLQAAYEKEIERRKRQMRGDPEMEAKALSEGLAKVDQKESYLLDVASDRSWPKAKLQHKLDDLDRQRKEFQQALDSVANRQRSIEQLRRDFMLIWARFHQIRDGDLRYLDPEGRRRMCEAMRLRAHADRESRVVLTGVFPEEISLPDLLDGHLDKSTKQSGAPEGSKVFVTTDSIYRSTS
jgi:site-specific DNA recombinase